MILISQEVETMGARREAALALALISVVTALTMEGMKKVGDKIVERQKKEQEILATWFLREEYLTAGWFKRFLLRLEFAFRDTRGESHIPQIPEHIRKEIARCLLPDIVAYFESERGQREFAEWKAQQEAEKKEKSEVA